jgi:hypothetical protein
MIHCVREWVGGLENMLLHSLDLFHLPLVLLLSVAVMSLFYPSWPNWTHSVRSFSGCWWHGSFCGCAVGFVNPFIDFLPPYSFLLLALIPLASVQQHRSGAFHPFWGFASFGKFCQWCGIELANGFGRHSHAISTNWSTSSEGQAMCVMQLFGMFSVWYSFGVVWGGSYEVACCRLPTVRLYVVNRTEDDW